MKATGIVRSLDNLGRVVLPIELRRLLQIDGKDAQVEIYTEDNAIVLRKFQPSCIFCGGTDDVMEFSGRSVCSHCREALSKLG